MIQLFHSIAILGIVDGERSQQECIMKIFTVAALTLVTGLSISTSANAQQTFARLVDEEAIQMANRIGACAQREIPGIASARFTDGGSILRVRCVGGVAGTDGMAGGLGTGVAAGAVALIAVAALASDGDSTTGTTSTTSTTGTN